LGISATHDDTQHYAYICNSSYELGTLEPDFDRALRVIAGQYLTIKHEKSPRADRVFKHLRDSEDNAAIIMCYYPSGDAHYYFVTQSGGPANIFKCINRSLNETVTYVYSKDITNDLRCGGNRKNNALKSHVWLITKKDLDDNDE
jgi:hypothetical protein